MTKIAGWVANSVNPDQRRVLRRSGFKLFAKACMSNGYGKYSNYTYSHCTEKNADDTYMYVINVLLSFENMAYFFSGDDTIEISIPVFQEIKQRFISESGSHNSITRHFK